MKTSNKLLVIFILLIFNGLVVELLATPDLEFVINTAISDLQIINEKGGVRAVLADAERIENSGAPDLPCKIIRIALPAGYAQESIEALPYDISYLGKFIDYLPFPADIRTDGNESALAPLARNESIYGSNDDYPGNYFELIDKGHFGDQMILTIRVNPLQYNPISGDLYLAETIIIKIDIVPSPTSYPPPSIGSAEIKRMLINPEQLTSYQNKDNDKFPMLYRQGTLGIGAEYLLITNAQMAPSFYPFVFWKNQKGIPAEIVLIDDILANYPGIDNAAKLRTYLQQAYVSGARWVLLGGDEDIIPIRYAFPGNVSYPITLDNQQICDLYYGDLTGNWDFDNDGIYGEMSHDRPDLYPEIYVGRVPSSTPEEAANWVRKALLYEQNPGNGDYSYLTRALFITADQMRDLNEHTALAAMMPNHFNVDYSRCAEEPSGGSPTPTQPTAQSVLEVINEGWGFISNLNHGNVSSYVTMAPNYNYAPRSYLWGDSVVQQDGAATILWQDSTVNFAIHYSISCDNAAFDFDKEVFRPGPFLTNSTFMEPFLLLPDRGGVGYLGNTRWGWVSASYRLEMKFLEYIFSDSAYQLGVAEALSKIYYPSYRDIDYGHNLFGDPEMAVWKNPPRPLIANSPSSITLDSQSLTITVSTVDGPVSGARVCAWKPGEFMFRGTTDASGEITIPLGLSYPGMMYITATGRDLVPDVDTVIVVTRAGIDDEQQKPDQVSLDGNYPNPFNSSTKIKFSLASSQQVSICIYDLAGRLIRVLTEDRLDAGKQTMEWDGRNSDGLPVASGIYLYALNAGSERTAGKMLLLK